MVLGCSSLCVVCCLVLSVCNLLFAVCCLFDCCLLFVVCCLFFSLYVLFVCRLLRVDRNVVFLVGCLPFVDVRVLRVVCRSLCFV